MKFKSLFALALVYIFASCNSQKPVVQVPVMEPVPTLSIDYKSPQFSSQDRAEALLQEMNLDEKLMQVQGYWQSKNRFTNEDGTLNIDTARVLLQHGIGQIGRPSDHGARESNGGGRTARDMAEYTNSIQKYLTEETRLGIPAIFHEECLHGHAAKDGTHFPQPIAFAGSFDRNLVEDLFTMTAKEARLRGAQLALTPVVDVVRDPRWGRTEETYGEDPYLAGEIGLAAVRGFQGRSGKIDEEHVMATLKHMTGHGQPESGTNIAPANISERIIREVFLPPFEKCIVDGHAQAVMASYNEIDGVPSHASTWLIQDILRGEWKFDGVVVSDYYAVEELHKRHSIEPDLAQAGKRALMTGVDIELPDPASFPLLKSLIENGELKESYLDQAVVRILKQKFDLGLFENPYVDPLKAEEFVGSKQNGKLALRAAEESVVLLKNEDNFAPIKVEDYKNIAVIGPNADQVLLGGYSETPPYFITFLAGLKEKYPNAKFTYAEGCGITEEGSWYGDDVVRTNVKEDREKIKEAVAVAKSADLVLLAIGGNELTSREAWAESHMGDRTDLKMVGLQDELLNEIAKTNTPIITFLFNGKPLEIQNVLAKSKTVYECWYLGQETGRATAKILNGEVNPSGKLVISFPRSVGHIPCYYNYKPTARRGYLFDDVSALFPFGYGLSYTQFSLDEPVLSQATITKEERTKLMVNITNSGDYDGKEVIQLYIRDVVSSVTRPVKELKGFEKIFIKKRETKSVSFTIGKEELWFWDVNMERVVEPGEFELMVGTSSDSKDLQKILLTVTN